MAVDKQDSAYLLVPNLVLSQAGSCSLGQGSQGVARLVFPEYNSNSLQVFLKLQLVSCDWAEAMAHGWDKQSQWGRKSLALLHIISVSDEEMLQFLAIYYKHKCICIRKEIWGTQWLSRKREQSMWVWETLRSKRGPICSAEADTPHVRPCPSAPQRHLTASGLLKYLRPIHLTRLFRLYLT